MRLSARDSACILTGACAAGTAALTVVAVTSGVVWRSTLLGAAALGLCVLGVTAWKGRKVTQ